MISKLLNGWLETFQNVHSISYKMIPGEADAVDINVVNVRVKIFAKSIFGLLAWNHYEFRQNRSFFQALLEKPLCLKNKTWSGEKSAKEQLTILYAETISHSTGSQEKASTKVTNKTFSATFYGASQNTVSTHLLRAFFDIWVFKVPSFKNVKYCI